MSSNSVAKGFIAELDGLRGIAILLVMGHRFWPATATGIGADMAGAGWIGVDLFFVISGFLITGILLDTRGERGYFRNFYARRVLRIFPLYYLFVGAIWIGFASNPAFRENAGSPFWYLVHLGNVPEGVLGHDVPYWLGPVWSLAIEEQFYLTFPLVVHVLDRRRLTMLLVGLILVSPVIRLASTLALPDHERVQYLVTVCRLDTIAVGCLLAVLVRTVDLERWRPTLCHLALATLPLVAILAVASGLDRTSPFDRVFGYSVVAVGCASVVALVILSRGARATATLRLVPLRYLGKLCFGLYLLHRPADTLVSAAAERLDFDRHLWLLPLKVAVAVGLATLAWRFVERPFLGLKDRFASARHPGAAVETARPLLKASLLLLLALAIACRQPNRATTGDDAAGSITDAPADVQMPVDAAVAPADAPVDGSIGTPVDAPIDAPVDSAPPDAGGGANGPILYPEGTRHSPINAAIVARIAAIAATSPHAPRVFAKVGDSITVSEDFLHCFSGGAADLGTHGDLAPTIAFFDAGNAAGVSPFARSSYASVGGTTAQDVLSGNPSPFARELAAIEPRISVIMFGTNEIRYDWSFDKAGEHLWKLVDESIGRGVVPILSSIPANVGYPAADARIPTFNRFVRAIAQGRGVPFVDLHRDLAPLPNRGISADGLHPSTAPAGGCTLTAAALQYGYNVRNLVTLEALARTRAALSGTPSDAAAPTRAGSGTPTDPFAASVPVVDLGDTRTGATIAPSCSGVSGRSVVYELAITAATTIVARVVDRGTDDVDVHIVAGAGCLDSGDQAATATVAPGTVRVVVTGRTAASDGEYLLVIERL